MTLYGCDVLPTNLVEKLEEVHRHYAAGTIRTVFFDAQSRLGTVIAELQYGWRSYNFWIDIVIPTAGNSYPVLHYRSRTRVLGPMQKGTEC
jgi:hypothetical protein